MSISRYFGLPGCGKTTVLTRLAVKAVQDPRYNHVYGNVHLNIPGYTYVPFECFGVFDMTDCLLLVDEATIECGDRDYKSFPKEKLARFMMHRHDNMDIALFSQSPDGTDKKIRDITDRMFYIKKGIFLGQWVSNVYRVPYKVLWPSADNNGGENAGRILMGYVKPGILNHLFALRVYRPNYYGYFDSWERIPLPPLPDQFQEVPVPVFYKGWETDFYFGCVRLIWSVRIQKLRYRVRSFINLIKQKATATEYAA